MNYKTISLLFLILICLIPVTSAIGINVDERTETSIVWNLTEILNAKTISYVAMDGIKVNNYYNTSLLVQNNLYPNEQHILTVNTTDNIRYTQNAYTIQAQQYDILVFINQYILILLILIVFVVAIFTEPLIGFIGFILAFIGIMTTINFSFELGTIFVILMVASFFVGVKDRD